MAENPDRKLEEAPPEAKRSFASEDALRKADEDAKKAEEKKTQPPQSPIKTIKIGDKEVPILPAEMALTLIYGVDKQILDELKTLNSLFSKAAGKSETFQNTTPQTQPAQPQSPAPAKPIETTPRVKEILAALEPVKDLLIIDLEKSTMFVLVKPAQFLGSDNFSKVNNLIRSIGGRYVSAGKDSHFEIPKAPLNKA
jgi:hypothetical protein